MNCAWTALTVALIVAAHVGFGDAMNDGGIAAPVDLEAAIAPPTQFREVQAQISQLLQISNLVVVEGLALTSIQHSNRCRFFRLVARVSTVLVSGSCKSLKRTADQNQQEIDPTVVVIFMSPTLSTQWGMAV